MSAYLWSLITRTRPVVLSLAGGGLLRSLGHRSHLPQVRPFSVKRLAEKKVERLHALRSVVAANYRANNSQSVHWPTVRQDLSERGLLFRTNFEFALLSAFETPELPPSVCEDGSVPEPPEPFQMDQHLFQSIADYVQQSPAVAGNKIAAIRYCRFLSTAPEFLSKPQIAFIRSVAERILEDNIRVPAIIVDVITALAHSSSANCLLAVSIYERYLTGDFKLKLDVLQIILSALVRYQLSQQLHSFILQHWDLMSVDVDLAGGLLRLVAKKAVFASEQSKTLDILRFLSATFAPIDAKYRNTLIDRVLVKKLGYTNIKPTQMSTQGVCSCCGTRLTGLTDEEFAHLKTNFRTIIFDKNDQYLIANLQEFEVQLYEFEDRIKEASPEGPERPKYDLIIDGLNVSYRKSSTIVRDETGLRTYARVYKIKDLDQQIVKSLQVNRVFDRHDRTLLIGREHMNRWFGLSRLLRTKSARVDAVYLLNRTRDDNYILYAAVQHPRTKILSGDYFRDHREKFKNWYLTVDAKDVGEGPKPNLPRIFNRWLRSRQIKIDDNHRLEYPNEFDIKMHVADDAADTLQPTLHIPIIVEQDSYGNEDHIYEWYCAKPR